MQNESIEGSSPPQDENGPNFALAVPLPKTNKKRLTSKCLPPIPTFQPALSLPSDHSEEKLVQAKESNKCLAKDNSALKSENGHLKQCMLELEAALALSQTNEFQLRREVNIPR